MWMTSTEEVFNLMGLPVVKKKSSLRQNKLERLSAAAIFALGQCYKTGLSENFVISICVSICPCQVLTA